MQYDGEKYYYGTKFINNADDLLTDIYKATDDIKGYHGFEYKDILNEIKMTIFEVMSECTAISNTIEMGRQNIASMSSDFDVEYLKTSHYDFSNMSVTEQEENRYLIKYTDEEIARELKKHQNNAANVDISDEALRASMMLNDQNFSNLSVEGQQDQIDNFRDEVIKYQKMSWYEKALKNTGAFVCGTVNGLANVAESVVDGAATLESACILYATPVGPLMHVVSHFQEQSGVAKDDTIVGKYKEKVKDFVDKNWVDDIYDGIVEKYGMNKYIWKGKYYTTGKTVGTMAGYTGLSFIPGGPVVTGIVSGLAAAGDAAETAYNNGASYDQGVAVAGIAGGVGFTSGVGLDKFRGASKLVTTKAGVLGYTLLGSGTAMSEPVVNAVAQYNLYAKNQIDENGNKVYNNFGDYFKKSGGLQSTFMAAGIGGASILPSAVKNYKTNLIETKLSQEMLDNVYRLDFDNPSQYNEYLDSLTPEQRTKFMTDYYNSGSEFSTSRYTDYFKKNFVPEVPDEKFYKYSEAYLNPKYYDVNSKTFHWPNAEGAKQFIHLTNEEFLKLANEEGIEGLKKLGAVEVTFEELRKDGLTRATWKSNVSDDIYGEYFGSSSTKGINDVDHRVLGPETTYTITTGDGNIYKMTIDEPLISTTLYDVDGYSELKIGPGTDYEIRTMKIQTADWFGQKGGADQYAFYVTDKSGKILTKNTNFGPQAYKLPRSKLEEMGIIRNIN